LDLVAAVEKAGPYGLRSATRINEPVAMDPHAAVERSRTFMSNSSALNSIWAGTARFRTSLPCRSRAGRYRSRNTWVGNDHEVRRLLVLEPGGMALGDLAAKCARIVPLPLAHGGRLGVDARAGTLPAT
jgi:hypothetical protein